MSIPKRIPYTTETFIEKCEQIHGDLYDYSLVRFKNVNTKIKIICNVHGEFEQRPDHHLEGRQCRFCKFDQNKKFRKYTKDEFIELCNIKHNNSYTYNNTIFDKLKGSIEITCPLHGNFVQIADKHLNGGDGCPQCGNIKIGNCKRLPFEFHIHECNEKHNYKYDYTLSNPVNNIHEKIKILCSFHGPFKQSLKSHKNGANCPKCKLQSKGEDAIFKFLSKHNLPFSYQKKFDKCINNVSGRCLKFDFYLEEINTAIEYDGKQHFVVVDRWGGKEGLDYRKKLDNIKDIYCSNNNIKLLRISYKDNIESVLSYTLFDSHNNGK